MLIDDKEVMDLDLLPYLGGRVEREPGLDADWPRDGGGGAAALGLRARALLHRNHPWLLVHVQPHRDHSKSLQIMENVEIILTLFRCPGGIYEIEYK